MKVTKRRSAEQRRVEELIRRQERRIQRAFATFLADARSDRVLREVRQFLEAGNVEAALSIVDEHVIPLANSIPRAFTDAAERETEALVQQIGAERARVSSTFDPTDELAARLMRSNRLRFVREFTDSQRRATRRAIADGLEQGLGSRDMARNFRDSIGLTERQWAAVGNYGRLLRVGSREALARDLRDRRFDRTVSRHIREGEPLSEAQIARMQNRYRERYLAMRSEAIARTEATRSVSQAREESTRQMIEEAAIDEQLVERTWRVTSGERTRDTHAAMDGQTVIGLETPFESPMGAELRYPGDPNAPPEETIHCRCVVTTRILQAQEMAEAA